MVDLTAFVAVAHARAEPCGRHAQTRIADAFAYYLTHRFVFHGALMREIHAVHHQARSPSSIDVRYVHPLETFVGPPLFVGAVAGLE